MVTYYCNCTVTVNSTMLLHEHKLNMNKQYFKIIINGILLNTFKPAHKNNDNASIL